MLWSQADRRRYRLVKRYVRKCPDCGRRMHKATDREMRELSCPVCGEKNRPGGEILWD